MSQLRQKPYSNRRSLSVPSCAFSWSKLVAALTGTQTSSEAVLYTAGDPRVGRLAPLCNRSHIINVSSVPPTCGGNTRLCRVPAETVVGLAGKGMDAGAAATDCDAGAAATDCVDSASRAVDASFCAKSCTACCAGALFDDVASRAAEASCEATSSMYYFDALVALPITGRTSTSALLVADEEPGFQVDSSTLFNTDKFSKRF